MLTLRKLINLIHCQKLVLLNQSLIFNLVATVSKVKRSHNPTLILELLGDAALQRQML